MAKVKVQVAGGSISDMEADDVAEIKDLMDAVAHTAKVNNSSQDDDYALRDGDFIALAPKVKAG